MRAFVRHLVPIMMVALASTAAVTIATPAVSSAQCADGDWRDPTGKVCGRCASGHNPWHASRASGRERLGSPCDGQFMYAVDLFFVLESQLFDGDRQP